MSVDLVTVRVDPTGEFGVQRGIAVFGRRGKHDRHGFGDLRQLHDLNRCRDCYITRPDRQRDEGHQRPIVRLALVVTERVPDDLDVVRQQDLSELLDRGCEDGFEVLGAEAGCGRTDHRDSLGRKSFDHDVVSGHGALLLDRTQARFDLHESVLLECQFLGDLGATQHEHSAELVERHVGDHLLDLVQRESEFLQRDDAVQLRELRGGIRPIPSGRIDFGGHQQSKLVIVPQAALRH